MDPLYQNGQAIKSLKTYFVGLTKQTVNKVFLLFFSDSFHTRNSIDSFSLSFFFQKSEFFQLKLLLFFVVSWKNP